MKIKNLIIILLSVLLTNNSFAKVDVKPKAISQIAKPKPAKKDITKTKTANRQTKVQKCIPEIEKVNACYAANPKTKDTACAKQYESFSKACEGVTPKEVNAATNVSTAKIQKCVLEIKQVKTCQAANPKTKDSACANQYESFAKTCIGVTPEEVKAVMTKASSAPKTLTAKDYTAIINNPKSDPKDVAQAQFGLGSIYLRGENDTKQDAPLAIKYITDFINNKNSDPEYVSAIAANLGANYYVGGDGLPQDYVQAIKYFTDVIKTNTPKIVAPLSLSQAQYYLGYMYYAGLGVTQSYSQAFTYWNAYVNTHPKIVDPKQLSTVQAALGLMYFNGLGVTQDYNHSFTYFNNALNSKNLSPFSLAGAQYYLGLMSQTGQGTTQNTTQANTYFASALAGFNSALTDPKYTTDKRAISDINYYLGQIYNNGYGVPQNTATALSYFNKVTQDSPWAYPLAQAMINASKVT
ncbi:MAG: tetratricopeptide repeat protein [Candidatus Babeliales bacterium]|nr:tetratricopeptide repeat protein [Candidatus Babeliales bacterium]